MKLRTGARISVVEFWNRNITSGVRIVTKARIKRVVHSRFVKLIHYRLEGPQFPFSENDGVVAIDAKGKLWISGWEGPQVNALRTVAALGSSE